MSDSNYIPRLISDSILEAACYFPVITLTGPRQSGKSTLLRHLFPNLPYISMEDPDTRRLAKDDPRGLLANYMSGVIIDEVQNTPDLLSYIQGIVDANPEARFYLTGSAQFTLMKSITQSLAGRSAVFELLPLSLSEIGELSMDDSLNQLLFKGFYPAIWSGRNIPRFLYPNYIKTYVEHDVRDLMNIKDLDTFHRFVKLCAARIGSVFNASELSKELGVAVNTVKSWLSILQTGYIVYLLPPFHTNTRKRLTKSPKLYFTDCGLTCSLLDIESPEMADRDKMRGHLFENMVIMEFLKKGYNEGKTPRLYFYRDSNGNEVDLLVGNRDGYDCYEIKSSATIHRDFTKGLLRFRQDFPDLTDNQYVVYGGYEKLTTDGINFMPYKLLGKNEQD